MVSPLVLVVTSVITTYWLLTLTLTHTAVRAAPTNSSGQGRRAAGGQHREWHPRNGTKRDFIKYRGRSAKDHHWVVNRLNRLRVMAARRLLRHDDSVELSINVTRPVWGGDMLLSRPQIVQLERHLNRTSRRRNKATGRTRRQVLRFDNFPGSKWTMPIIYKIDTGYSASQAAQIEAALASWMNKTCVTFSKVNVSATVDEQHILFATDPSLTHGCESFVGKVTTSVIPQQIYLDYPGCLNAIGVPIHEIGHALGLYHEQSRADRDQYIKVITSNIDPTEMANFAEMDWETAGTFNVSYDYGSVMHYGSQDFQVTGHAGFRYPTLLPMDSTQLTVLGQRTEISFYDAELINDAYCNDVCKTKLPCQQGGYTDPKDCSRCRCPDGWGGTLCDTLAAQSTGCQPSVQTMSVTTTAAYLNSPNYGSSLTYLESTQCTWLLSAPTSQRVTFWFDPVFSLLSTVDGACQHWVEVKYKQTHVTRGQRFCGSQPSALRSSPVTSSVNVVSVHFRAPQHGNFYLSNSIFVGFRLGYQIGQPSASCTVVYLPSLLSIVCGILLAAIP